jgi:hypothetical protein
MPLFEVSTSVRRIYVEFRNSLICKTDSFKKIDEAFIKTSSANRSFLTIDSFFSVVSYFNR